MELEGFRPGQQVVPVVDPQATGMRGREDQLILRHTPFFAQLIAEKQENVTVIWSDRGPKQLINPHYLLVSSVANSTEIK